MSTSNTLRTIEDQAAALFGRIDDLRDAAEDEALRLEAERAEAEKRYCSFPGNPAIVDALKKAHAAYTAARAEYNRLAALAGAAARLAGDLSREASGAEDLERDAAARAALMADARFADAEA